MYLFDINDNKYIKINTSGKNISFIPHYDELYFIHYIKPFVLCKFDIETGKITQIDVDDDGLTYNYEYRGGTPGYKLTDDSYYGFGHRTYFDTVLKHDIFIWIVSFETNKLPNIFHLDITQPPNSKNICDPTSVIYLNNKKYLITAETNEPWFSSQDYTNNVYELET